MGETSSLLLVVLVLGCGSQAAPPGDAGLDAHDGSDAADAGVDAATKAELLYSYTYSPPALLAFPVNPSTGAIGASTSFGGPNSCGGMVASPSGQYLYVSSTKSDAVDVFSINASTGALQPIAGSPFSLGNASGSAGAVAIDPSGHFLYVTDWGAQNVVGFSIDGSTGALTRLQATPTGTDPLGALVEPQGRFLYVGNTNDVANGSVSAWAINSTNGALTPVPGSPFATIPYGSPQFFVAHPNGKFLYVSLPGGKPPANVLGAYVIGADGALSPVTGSPYPVGGYPLGVAIDPAGKTLYVANNADGTISAFTIDSNTGALTKLVGSPFSAGLGGGGMPRGPWDLRVDLAGKVLFCSDATDPNLLGFSIDSTGALGDPMVTGTNGADTLYLAIARVQ